MPRTRLETQTRDAQRGPSARDGVGTDRSGHEPGTEFTVVDGELTRRVGRDVLQRLQDRFAALGRVTVCTCTVDGELLTRPTWGSRYSELIATSPLGRAALSDAVRICARDPRAKVPSICHEDMMLYATPVRHADGRHLATIVVGTRRPPDADAVRSAEGRRHDDGMIRALAVRYQIDDEELCAAARAERDAGGDPEAIHRFADVLAETIATLFCAAEQIQRQLADLRTVHDVAELLSGTRDLQEILDLTVRRVVEVMSVKACAIRLLDEDTGELVIKAVANLSKAYIDKGPVMLESSLIDRAAFEGRAVYIEDARTDPRMRYPQNARREGIVSGLCVPLAHRGRTVGVIRVYTGVSYRFSQSEESLLRSIGSQAAAAIINAHLREEQIQSEQYRRQMASAAAIQQRMLPVHRPPHSRLRFGCVYDPTLAVGGDFYDFIELGDGRWALGIADVAGKGLPAALLMASVRSTLRACATGIPKVNHVVHSVNRQMYRDTLVSEFATLVYGVFSPDGRSFTYCNAGHLPPLLLRDGAFLELATGGMVVGVNPQAEFECETVRLAAGDVLVLVTDGVTEAMDFTGSVYGAHRLRASVLGHRGLDAQQLAMQLLWDVRRFAGLAHQTDDITIVVVKVQ